MLHTEMLKEEKGRGVRRGREEDAEGGSEGGAEGGRVAKKQAGHTAGDVLAGLRFEGPAWRLPGGGGGREEDGRMRGCEAMLEQALGCSDLADVRFVFDDGKADVGGHRGLLAAMSEVFEAMFRTGMEERKTGRVRVSGVSRESFRAFLEFVYLGQCGARVRTSDGRELWVLAEAYQVVGLREWLVREGVWSMGSACAAMQYAKSAEGGDFEELVEACAGRALWDLPSTPEEALRGVCLEAAAALLEAHGSNSRLWRGCDVLEGFRWAERWVRANGGAEAVGAAGIERLVGPLQLWRLPLDVLAGAVRPSGLVCADRLFDLSTACYAALRKQTLPGGGDFKRARMYGYGCPFAGGRQLKSVGSVALDGSGGGAGELLAVSDPDGKRVHVYRAASSDVVRTIEWDAGWAGVPRGVAFNGRGELFVGDAALHCIHVFSTKGELVRTLGRSGCGEGQLLNPSHLAVSPQGHVIVSDGGNCRVQVLRQDGSFLRAFGEEGRGAGQLVSPRGVALGADGSIVIADQGNARVQIFDSEGVFVRAFGLRGQGRGEFTKPEGLCVLPAGEICVCDSGRGDVQVFSWEGQFLRSIGKEGDSKVDLHLPAGVAADAQGRLLVGYNVLATQPQQNKRAGGFGFPPATTQTAQSQVQMLTRG